MKMTIEEFCRKHDACEKGMKWAIKNCKDMDEVWQNAKPEWLIWVATREGVLTDKELRLFAVWCARQVQHLMTDERSIAAIDVAERYANGKATDEELNEARRAVWVPTTNSVVWTAVWATARVGVEAWDANNASEAAALAACGKSVEVALVAMDMNKVAWVTARAAQAEYLRQNCKPNFER